MKTRDDLLKEVIDEFTFEELARMTKAMRDSLANHPAYATCDCPMIEVLVEARLIQQERAR